MYYRELIEKANDQHSTASLREEKTQITWNIVKEIEERNGRFLEYSKHRNMWILLNDREMVRTKVAAAIKQYNRQIKTRMKIVRSKNQVKEAELQLENATAVVEENDLKGTSLSTNENHQVRDECDQQYQLIHNNIRLNGGGSVDANVISSAANNQVIRSNFLKNNNIGERSLQHYYSKQHVDDSKRRKTTMLCGGYVNHSTDAWSSDVDADDSCFGRSFFPT